MTKHRYVLLLAAVLAGFVLLAYGPSLGLPFVGDDYVFLDETMNRPLSEVLTRDHTAFRWYRPWSREAHFWAIEQVAGISPLAFRVVGVTLWICVLLAFQQFTATFTSPRQSLGPTLCAAVMSLWGTPILWISGSQDLWALLFGLGFLNCVARREDLIAAVLLCMALLSKESSAILPVIGIGYALLIQREPLWGALLRGLPGVGITVLWSFWHPTLLDRLTESRPEDPELVSRGSLAVTLAKNVLACVNLDAVPRPSEVVPWDVLRAAGALGILAAGYIALQRMAAASPEACDRVTPRRAVAFAGVWAALGWLPTLAPSIGWHAYYGAFGALGIWALAAVLAWRRTSIFVAALVAMTFLRSAAAHSPSWDWGSEWYLRRAGHLLSAIKDQLRSTHPSLEPHTRVFFGRLPNNIGLVAGSSAALRVWYHDSTLTADFMSSYRPRGAGRLDGPDLFFRFDSVRVLVEVVPGEEDIRAAIAQNPEWVEDHTKLAMLFLRSGDPLRAGDEFLKLAKLPAYPAGLLYAAASFHLGGDPARTERALDEYSTRKSIPADSVRRLVRVLIDTAPTRALP